MKTLTTLFRHMMAKRLALVGVLPALGLFGYSQAHAADLTLPEELIGATEGFLEFMVEDYLERSEITARHEIQVNPLDPRLRLAACDSDLTQSLESPAQPVGRVTVRVSCEGSTPWTVFVPAQVRIFRPVVVVKTALRRDSIIGAGDVALVEQDVSLLNRGYVTEVEQVIGRKLTRATRTDQVLTPAMLQLAEAVRRGDQVVISARSGGINVRMQGEALSGGTLGQQISVRNLTSQRVIRARVAGPGQVEVEM
ncbi:flagellar basal body P-ring formation chaperone FlgA [Aquipseudomonas alcaligenes]|uniref:Flagella basal body P-ring formation protein FlgA n=1 Tax=Aquipseudomonas alcaligenes TaxID=43263 RepID=A0A5C7VWK5_AQUAC|nr:flagellar basal body P-ring formation chaperone FlgA [Pseudomonas alcaligenes]MDH0141559.1 flagellar basal body P-ring formation chaperone FlgA [Pseudomonas alcaligenes]TXI29921.1 MAG: flagellar basal body P-ring formation protein FlgA [Pseudomonas alcaligenes]